MPLASNNNSAGSSGGTSGMKNVSPSQIATMNGNGQQQYTEYTTTNIPAFLSKLWTLVEDPKYNQLIAWDAVSLLNLELFSWSCNLVASI